MHLFALCALASSVASAQMRVSGTVTDSAGTPLLGAEVLLLVGGAPVTTTRTREDGAFTVIADMTSPSKLQARRLGFNPRLVELVFPADSARSLKIALDASPVVLSDVDVDWTRTGEMGGWLKDFYDRRRTNSFGRYYTREAIQARGAQHMSEILRGQPGVTLTASRRFGYVVRFRGCRYAPLVWLDGVRLQGAELDDVAKPADIAAMEVYPSSAGIPAQFMDRSNSGCGTILIWTRHQ
jgi:carboxypeptidase family protein/TonB-dependent receptor-like protein